MGFGEEDHRAKVPFSPHHIEDAAKYFLHSFQQTRRRPFVHLLCQHDGQGTLGLLPVIAVFLLPFDLFRHMETVTLSN